MLKHFILGLVLVSCSLTVAEAANNPATIPSLPSITAMQSLGIASPQYGTVIVTGTQGGTFLWVSGSLPCNSSTGGGDTGTTFCAGTSGSFITTGFWQRQYVGSLNAAWFNGSDIGTQINAAYTSLPASGGKIIIDPKVGGGCINYSVPIVFSTKGKYPLLEGLAPGGATVTEGSCLNYIPTTATAAITEDYANTTLGPPGTDSGITNLTLFNNSCVSSGGCGSSATGILVGLSNGGDWDATYNQVTIYGFGMGYNNLNNTAVTQQWNAGNFQSNTVAMTIAGATERFVGGQFAGNGKVFVAPSGAAQGDLYFVATTFFDNKTFPNFDYNSATTAAGNLDCSQCHWENSPADLAHYIEGNFNLVMTGGLVEDDRSVGTGDWMFHPTFNYTNLSIIGTQILSDRLYTQVVLVPNLTSGTLSPFMLSASNLPTVVGGANAAGMTVQPLATANVSPFAWSIPSPLTLGNGLTIQSVTTNTGGENVCITSSGLLYKTSSTC